MWSLFQGVIIQAALAILQVALANHPNATAEEKLVIKDLAQVATAADAQVNGNIWTLPAAPAAPAA
jgi:hypothetical protein